jgi:uncharacterized phage protein (TIGR02218 family)
MATSADGALTALAFCWRIERADGAGIALTSHEQGIDRGGVSYAADPGLMPAAIERRLGLEPGSAEVAGALSSEALTETDLALGRWDGAKVRLAAFDWSDDAAEAIDLMGGELGEVSLAGESFSAELRGASARLAEPVCPSTSPECRARFGDKQCRVDLAGRVQVARVVSSSGNSLVLDADAGEGKMFGRLRYLSGANCGLDTVVLGVDGKTVRVRDLPRAEVEPGCRVELRDGCDKRFETCVTRFANAVNFRGEPHLPGNDLLMRYPGA